MKEKSQYETKRNRDANATANRKYSVCVDSVVVGLVVAVVVAFSYLQFSVKT